MVPGSATEDLNKAKEKPGRPLSAARYLPLLGERYGYVAAARLGAQTTCKVVGL